MAFFWLQENSRGNSKVNLFKILIVNFYLAASKWSAVFSAETDNLVQQFQKRSTAHGAFIPDNTVCRLKFRDDVFASCCPFNYSLKGSAGGSYAQERVHSGGIPGQKQTSKTIPMEQITFIILPGARKDASISHTTHDFPVPAFPVIKKIVPLQGLAKACLLFICQLYRHIALND